MNRSPIRETMNRLSLRIAAHLRRTADWLTDRRSVSLAVPAHSPYERQDIRSTLDILMPSIEIGIKACHATRLAIGKGAAEVSIAAAPPQNRATRV